VDALGLPTGEDWDRVVRQLRLSCRQAEVTHALLCNMTVPEAAAALGLRPDTVKTYLKRTYQRLDVTSRVELAICIMAAAQPGPRRPAG
jgi:DNA-binding NarL/FixJ family response regulator